MLARYAVRKEHSVNKKSEKINILTTVSRWESNAGNDWALDGYNVEMDINTWQYNKVNRFGEDDIVDFIRVAEEYQEEIRSEVFND